LKQRVGSNDDEKVENNRLHNTYAAITIPFPAGGFSKFPIQLKDPSLSTSILHYTFPPFGACSVFELRGTEEIAFGELMDREIFVDRFVRQSFQLVEVYQLVAPARPSQKSKVAE
jgi:hypothetical protein